MLKVFWRDGKQHPFTLKYNLERMSGTLYFLWVYWFDSEVRHNQLRSHAIELYWG